jgi:periplasmic protein CpxP/Spy
MKRSLLILTILFAGTMAAVAQGGPGGPQRTVEERVKSIHDRLQTDLKLDAAKQTQVDSVFAGYYRSQDKLRQEMSNGGQPDFQAMREKMQPLTDARDEKLKPILGDANYKKWKEEIEPSMRRPRN